MTSDSPQGGVYVQAVRVPRSCDVTQSTTDRRQQEAEVEECQSSNLHSDPLDRDTLHRLA